MWNQVPIFWLRGWKRARETNVDTNVPLSLLIWSIYYAKTGITRFKTGRNRVPLATRIVGVASVDASETNDVRLDKAHKVSLVPIEKLVDGPRSKISSSGGRRNRLFSFNRCTVFTRVANRRERSNIREPVAESVGWSRTKPVEGN